MTRRLLSRLLPVIGLALLAACSNLTGPQSSTLSSSAVNGQDPQHTTQGTTQTGGTSMGTNGGQKPATGGIQ